MTRVPWEIVSTKRPYILRIPDGRQICVAGKIYSVAGINWNDIPESAKYQDGLGKNQVGALICKPGVRIADFHWVESRELGPLPFATVSMPIISGAIPQITASNITTVQPMNIPAGLTFYIDYPYGIGP